MRALILGGGGTLGAFSAGALQALESRGWQADIWLGSSAGGINLLRAFVGGAREAIAFWQGLDYRRLLLEAVIAHPGNGGVLNETKFWARVERDVSFEKLRTDPRTMGFMVVDLESGRVGIRSNRTEPDAERLRLVSRAAYAMPPLLPPVREGSRLLADGGLLYNAPLEAAVKLGATEIVYLCNVQTLPHQGHEADGTISATARFLDIFFRRASNVGFADQEVEEHVWRDIPVLVIAPPATRGILSIATLMVPSKRGLSELIALGHARAHDAIEHFEVEGPGLGLGDP